MTWKVMVPSARHGLMVGVNQVIMLSLNMVIIASMIGAGGLGFDVLAALRRLDIGAGIESGVAIVVLAVALDRLSQAFAENSEVRKRAAAARIGEPFYRRFPNVTAACVIIVTAGLAGLALPSDPGLSGRPGRRPPGDFGGGLSAGSTSISSTRSTPSRSALLLNLLIPVKRFLGELPWAGVVAALTLGGYALGGRRLAALCFVLPLLIVVTGQWEKATVTVYLCGISVVIACLIGVPIAIWASTRERAWRHRRRRHRHAADPAELRLSDARRHAFPRR